MATKVGKHITNIFSKSLEQSQPVATRKKTFINEIAVTEKIDALNKIYNVKNAYDPIDVKSPTIR